MANPSIGGYEFITIGGRLTPEAEELVPFNRPGVDGTGYVKVGARAPERDFIAERDFDNATDLTSAINTYTALRSTLVTVVDDVGVSASNVMVLEVEVVSSRTVANAVGGITAGNYLLRIRFRLQMTS